MTDPIGSNRDLFFNETFEEEKNNNKNAAAVPADNSTHLDNYVKKAFKSWTAPVPITLPDYSVLLFQAM